MVFSSLVFCAFFARGIPWASASAESGQKNAMLLLASLHFMRMAKPIYVFMMIGSAFMNYLWAHRGVTFPEEAEASFGNGG